MTGKELGPMPSKSSSASLESPGSRSFSSEPVAPVVASSHSRRNNAEMSWRMAGHGEEHDSMNNRVQAGQMAASSSGGSSHAASPSNSSYRDDRSDGSQVTSDDEMRGPTRGNANAAAASSNSAASNEGGGGGTSAPTNKRGMHFRSQSPDGSDSDTASENGGSSTAQRRVLPSLAVPSAGNSGQQQKHPADDERRSGRNPNGSAWTNGNRPPKNGDSPDTAGYPVGQEEDPPSPDDQDVKIMFHGREVYADDLIGLRVAKTFVGHGRFLGQVVKFDDASQLYTVVYADGDAEELSVENTIQVLIQDEIERADPTAPPVTINYRKDRPQAPDSPTTASAGQSFAPPAPVHQAPLQQLDRPEKISELEAQFMVGLFENHAVPELLRKGWKIQTSTNGTEQRFVAPPGNFPGAGRCFNSALEVIEMIASDAAMLDACFPKNVHQAITSVFSGTSRESRKRSQSAPGEAEYYDPKRPRSARGSPRDAHLPAALPGRGHGQDERSFGLDGREREREHDGHLGHRIVAPSAGQYAGGPQRLPQVYTESRTLSHDSGDLRRPVSDIRGGLTAPLRPLSQNGTPPPRSWSANSHTPPVDNGDYRRPFPEAEWRNRDGFGMRGSSQSAGLRRAEGQYRGGQGGAMYEGGRPEGEGGYYQERGGLGRHSSGFRQGADTPPGGFRHGGLTGGSNSPGDYRRLPNTVLSGSSANASTLRDSAANFGGSSRPSFQQTSGGRGSFSMQDVDSVSSSRQQPKWDNQRPVRSDAQGDSGAYMRHHGQHFRSSSGYSMDGSESGYVQDVSMINSGGTGGSAQP